MHNAENRYAKHRQVWVKMLYNKGRCSSPCVKFDCDDQSECATEKVECKAFRYWVNNDSYWTMRKGKKTSIDIDMKRLLKEIE